MPTTRRTSAQRRAYAAGRAGEPFPAWIDDDATEAEYERGLADHKNGAATSPTGSSSGRKSHAGGSSSSRSSRSTKPGSPAGAARGSSAAAQADWERKTSSQRAAAGRARVGDELSDEGGAAQLPAARIGSVTVNDGAGFLLGLVVFALARAFLAGGSSEAKEWLAAKFLNRPGAKAATTGGTSAGTTKPTAPAYPVNPGSQPATVPTGPFTPTQPGAPNTSRTVPGNYGVGGRS